MRAMKGWKKGGMNEYMNERIKGQNYERMNKLNGDRMYN